MASGDSLESKQISATYKDLLQVPNSNSGVDATTRTIMDGEGTESALQVSTTEVKSTGTIESTGNTTVGGSLILGAQTLTATATELNLLDGITEVDADISTASSSDDTLASAKAIKNYVDNQSTLTFTGLTDTPSSLTADKWLKVNSAGTALEETAAPEGTSSWYVQRFDGDGSTVAFTLSQEPASENNTQVYISGVYQQKDTYSVSTTTLTFSEAPETGTGNIEVVTNSTSAIGATTSDLVTFSPTGTGSTNRTTQAKLRDVVSVKDFGATGDGSTDDTTAIQAAIDALTSDSGGMLYFPAGTYKTTDVLTIETAGYTDSVHFVGSGKVSSIIKQTTTGKGVLEIGGRQHSVRDIKLQGVEGDSSAVVLAFGETDNGNDCNNNTVSNVSIKYGADGISMKDCWGIYVSDTHISAPSRSCVKVKYANFNIFENVSMDGVGDDLGGLEEASIWYVYDADGTPSTNTFRHVNHNGSKGPIVKFDGVSPTNEIFEEFYDDNAAGFISYATTTDLLNSQKCTFKNVYSNTRLPAWLKTSIDPFYWKKLGLQTQSGDKVNSHPDSIITNDHATLGNLAANGDFSRMTSSTRVDDWIHWNSYDSSEIDVATGAAYDGHAATGAPHSLHLTSSTASAAPYSIFSQRGSLTDASATSTNNVLDENQTYLISAKVKVISNVGQTTKLWATRAYYDISTAYSGNHTHPDISFTSGWQTLTCLTSGLPANTGTVGGLYLPHDGGASQILIADFKIVEVKLGSIKTATIHVPETTAGGEFEIPVFSPNIPVVITETFIIPSSDITGANTNYMTLEFRSKGTDGTEDTLISDTDYTSGSDAADWVKYLVGCHTTGSGTIGGRFQNGKTDLTTDEVVTVKKSATGTGMVTPAMTVGVTYFIP